MHPVIRPATDSDAALLPDIERSAGQRFRAVPALAWIADDDVLSAQAHLDYIAAGTSWVAEDDDGKVQGFLCAERFDTALHIWELAVHHDRQGRGYGRALVAEAIAHARRQRLSTVTLTTFRDVPWNAPFYQRLGFESLTGSALDERLTQVLERERKLGLPVHLRCAMRLALARPKTAEDASGSTSP